MPPPVTVVACCAVILWALLLASAYFLQASRTAAQDVAGMVSARYAVSEAPLSLEATAWSGISFDTSTEHPVPAHYVLENGVPRSLPFALVSFVDFMQVPVSIAGREDLVHRLEAPASTAVASRFEVPAPSVGAHDQIQLLVWEPDRHSVSMEWRISTVDGWFTANRTRLVAGDSSATPSYAAPTVEGVVDTMGFDGVLTNRSATQVGDLWTAETVAPAALVPFYVHVGNAAPRARTFALVALMDWRQTTFTASGSKVVFLSVPAGQTATLSGVILAPVSAGVHEFQVFRFEDPYDPVGAAGKTTSGSATIACGARLALEVAP